MEFTDRDNRCIQRIDTTGHDRLKRRDQLRSDQYRVDALVRARRVTAQTLDVNVDVIGRCHGWADACRESTDRHARRVVHAIDLIDLETIHQTVLDHRLCTRTALFRRLEDHHRIASEIPGLSKIACGAEQHCGMTVMSTGVHLPRHGGAIGNAGFFLDGQRVHVRAQTNRFQVAAVHGLASLDNPDHAGAPKPRHDFIAAKLAQPICDEGCRAMHIVHQFRMRMQIAAPAHDFRLQIGNAVENGHGGNLTKQLGNTRR